jgi:adenine phosphoribosyltransferase
VLLLDDVLATGGTLAAAADLLVDAGAQVAATAVVLELSALGGREQLSGHTLTALVQT